DNRCWNHQPHCAWFLQFLHEIDHRICSDRMIFDQFCHRLWRSVEDNTAVSSLNQSAHHVGAHPAQPYHSELHKFSSFEYYVCHCANCVTASRNNSIAAVMSLSAPNTDVPATSTLAPAATASGAVASSIPPSTSNSQSHLLCAIIFASRRIF